MGESGGGGGGGRTRGSGRVKKGGEWLGEQVGWGAVRLVSKGD